MPKPSLYWLADAAPFPARIKHLEAAPAVTWEDLVALAMLRLDFVRTERLDALLRRHYGDVPPPGLQTRPVRMALLSSSTTSHLAAGLRVAALRRNIWLQLHEGEFGQYAQELQDPGSALHAFAPDVVLFSFDAAHLFGGDLAHGDMVEQAMARMRRCWDQARRHWNASVLQQTVLPTAPALVGSNEQCHPRSPAGMIARLNDALRAQAEAGVIHLLSIDQYAAQHGIAEWHDPVLWHRAKQEVSPVAAPVYGDLAGRLLAALQGRSAKCLVLDLDNTLWGGVIGDDGLEGIVIGQGSATGEAFLSVQAHARRLADRGIILAVCSKNDERNALLPFEQHPDMLLRRSDIAAFVANWDDKAANLRLIARSLRIGLDSLVFLDDNPFERELVRAELPEVSVPEIPDDDPALVPGLLSDAGYFEALLITGEDLARTGSYQADVARAALEADATDMDSYLRSLDMRLLWSPFDRIGLGRIAQLINKTNQFNLTTRRYAQDEVGRLMDDPSAITLQFRLVDRLGDNGIIAVLIAHVSGAVCLIDSWLMSCRVLGRGVERACMAVLARQAAERGATEMVGTYRPTARNGMVAAHYPSLGFGITRTDEDGGHFASLVLDGTITAPETITIAAAAAAQEQANR